MSVVIFFNFLEAGVVFGENFFAKLNFRQISKTLLPKSFLQFETPRSLVLAPTPSPNLNINLTASMPHI